MKSITAIIGTLLFAVLPVPIAQAQERPEPGVKPGSAGKYACEGPYKGVALTQQRLQKILDDSRVIGASLNLCGAHLEKLDLSGAVLTRANLTDALLNRADLNNANLSDANLSGAKLIGANLSGAVLQPAKLVGADLSDANLSDANLNDADLSRAVLRYADLSKALVRQTNLNGADLSGANMRDANLTGAILIGANLSGADLSTAILRKANLSKANLGGAELRPAIMSKAFVQPNVLRVTNLSGADLSGADLSGALLRDTNLTGAILSGADLSNATYEPRNQPDDRQIAHALGLPHMKFMTSPIALVTLREAFKKAGFREQERQVTYAIKQSEAANSIHPDPSKPEEKPSWIEYGFNLVLFDLTSRWGMEPGRPLKILASLIFVFLLPYAIALKRQSGGGIWMVWSKDRVLTSEGTDTPVRMTRKGFRRVWTAFHFSLLAAFNIGWQEINVGNWISRVQSHEYSLQATGWVRTVAGIQSLISVYLVALWALTYFGRPFE